MFDSQISYIFKNWSPNDSKIFKWLAYPFQPEYLVIRKEKIVDDVFNYVCLPESTTIRVKSFTESELKHMMATGEITYEREHNYFVDVKKMKTNGCECGAWATGSADNVLYLHSTWCPMYFNLPLDGRYK